PGGTQGGSLERETPLPAHGWVSAGVASPRPVYQGRSIRHGVQDTNLQLTGKTVEARSAREGRPALAGASGFDEASSGDRWSSQSGRPSASPQADWGRTDPRTGTSRVSGVG